MKTEIGPHLLRAIGMMLFCWLLSGFQPRALSADRKNDLPLSDLEKVRAAYRAHLAGAPGHNAGIAGRIKAAEGIKTIDPQKHGALMHALARDWYHHHHDASRETFTRLFKKAYDQGYKPGGKQVGWYGDRSYLKALGLMVEDLDAPHRQMCAEFLFHNGGMEKRLSWHDKHKGGINTDYIHCDWFGAFGGVLYKGDDGEAVRNCRRLKRWLEIAFKPSPGTDDFIKVDGTSFHHWTHYNAYMYAFTTLSDHLYMLHDTEFQISRDAYIFFRNAAYSLLLMSNGNNYANSLAGRHPFKTGLPMSQGAYKKLCMLGGDVLGTGAADPFLARAYNRTWPGDDELSRYGAEPFPTGFWQFNYSPVGIYRQGNWVATLKGMNDVLWGAEIYKNANRYGRYQSYGVVEIMYPGGREGSGFHEKGWDWNMPCGGTTILLPWDKLVATLVRIDERNQRDFAGALSFMLRPDGLNGIEGEYGMYGVDFKELVPSGGGAKLSNHNASFRFKKSMFCFDGMIVCLGSESKTRSSRTQRERPCSRGA